MSSRPDVANEPGPPSAEDAWSRQPAPAARRGRTKAVVAALLSLAVLGVLGLYAVGYALAGDNLPRNATVSGVAVGGLDRKAAITKLTDAISPDATRPIAVTVAGEVDEIDPADAGLTVDYAASIDAAGGGKSFDPRQIWRVLTGGANTDVITHTDQGRLEQAVAALAERHDAKPRDAALAFDGATVDQTKGRTGVAVDQAGTAALVEQAFLSRGAIEAPAAVTEPDVTTAEMKQVVDEFAEPAVSGPVRLRAGQAGAFEISPRMIAKSISFETADGTLVPRLGRERLREVADEEVDSVALKKPKDATVRLVDGKPKVIPAVNGTSISTQSLGEAVEALLTKTGNERVGTVELSGAAARFSTADAKRLGVKEVTGKFTTYFPYAPYRNVNIPRAAELINNTLVKPGDTFSLNEIVGERTKANGFAEGLIIKGGKFRKELGGGVSQSATTTFNAMFFAGLKDVEHKPHTLYINRYPAGREATVAWPGLDLKFANDTKYGVLVQATSKKASPGERGSITVKLWSTKTYDKVTATRAQRSNFTTGRDLTDDDPKCEPQEAVPGFDVSFQRLFWTDGEVVKRENFFWRYAPTDRVRCT